MKRIGVVVLGLSLAALLFYFIVFNLPFLFVSKERIFNEANCRNRASALEENILGTIIEKFRDNGNHMVKTIRYSDQKGSKESVIFSIDRSGAFDYLLVGDSIFKARGNLEISIHRKGIARKFQLDYNCDSTMIAK